MATLNIYLLGDFRLVYDSRLLTSITTRRMQSLLAYLVLNRETPQPRQRIAFLLWPESDSAQARTNLRNLIHQLLQALPEAHDFLCTDGPAIQWKPDSAFVLDVAELEKAMTSGAFDAVVSLYAGDLLPDCYDQWVEPKREHLRLMYAEALGRLILKKEIEHDYHTAISYAQDLIRHEPLLEQSYQELMRLYALSGERTGIIRTYNTCITVLQNELGIEPSAATREMYGYTLKMHPPIDSNIKTTLSPRPNITTNLPYQVTAFIGRESEKTEVKKLVITHRLVTLTGAGGVGKTRLALAVAEDLLETFADGIWYVDLASFSDYAHVVQAVAVMLGVREEARSPLSTRLADYLLKKHTLLLLDNCENVADAVRTLTETLLYAVPDLRFLVASRIVLNMQGEVIWHVPSLSMPDMSQWASPEKTQPEKILRDQELAAFRQYESVQFFADRAASVMPTFAVTKKNAWYVGRICQQLDGIPLALELAAARVKLLTVQKIAEHLEDALSILTQGSVTALPHHQTMQATLDWSHNRLAKEDQMLFRRLSVFAGGATFEAIESICSGNGIEKDQVLNLLSILVDKSLVTTEPSNGAIRFRLHEVTRQYAQNRLEESGEQSDVKNHHLEYFCCLFETTEPDLLAGKSDASIKQQLKEHDNVQAALEWSIQDQGNAQFGLRLATASIGFWEERGLIEDGRKFLEKLLSIACASATPTIYARALTAAGRAVFFQGDFPLASSLFELSLSIDRESNNALGMANNLSRLGVLSSVQQKYATALPLLKESLELYRSLDNLGGIADVMSVLGYIALRQGDYPSAHLFLEDSLSLFGKLGMNHAQTRPKTLLGFMARLEKDYTLAKSLYNEAIHTLIKKGDFWGVIYLLGALGGLRSAEKRFEQAARIFGAAEHLSERLGVSWVPTERIELERDMAVTRAELGEQAFAAAWAEGGTLTPEQAMECALEEPS